MGGRGSGGTNQRHWELVEEHTRVSAALLNRWGHLANGAVGGVQWPDGSSVGIRAYEKGVLLVYTTRQPDGSVVQHAEPIAIDEVLKPYGGSQPYFLCPRCDARVLHLYRTTELFLCRKCSGLVYATTQERDNQRGLRKARKIRSRLGASENLLAQVWSKPRGMHHYTFYRRKIELQQAEQRFWGPMEVWLDDRMKKIRRS